MAETDIKTEYEKLQKKYKLPLYAELNQEFELGELEKKEFLLRHIRRKMREKLLFFCRILEGILYPSDRSPLTAYESGFFDDYTKLQLSKVHKTLMIFDRQSLLLDIDDSEEKTVEYILKLWKEWTMFKEELSRTIRIMEQSWEKTVEEKTTQGYFG